MSQAITTFSAQGKPTFHPDIDRQDGFDMPLGKMTMLFTVHDFPPKLPRDDSDIKQFLTDRATGLGPGVPCPPGGTSVFTVDMPPGLSSPMSRVPAMGVAYVLQGSIALELEGGESRVLHAGDVGVLRGAAHTWRNVTPDGGRAKFIGFSQSTERQAVSGS